MINWTKLTHDPLNPTVRQKVLRYLLSIRRPLQDNDYNLYLQNAIKGKDVLDIGICEHTPARMASPGWKHNIIRNHASYTLGVDIDHALIHKLKNKGYNVVHCDATSKINLKRKFDIVHVGDVIEHVSSPVELLNFCKRHLKKNGKIIIRTPNAYNFNYVHLFRKHHTDLSNLEHMFYICPIHMLEIARRTGLTFKQYLTLYPGRFSMKALRRCAGYLWREKSIRHVLAEFFAKPESYSTIYVYEVTH